MHYPIEIEMNPINSQELASRTTTACKNITTGAVLLGAAAGLATVLSIDSNFIASRTTNKAFLTLLSHIGIGAAIGLTGGLLWSMVNPCVDYFMPSNKGIVQETTSLLATKEPLLENRDLFVEEPLTQTHSQNQYHVLNM